MDKLEKEEFDALNAFTNVHAIDYLRDRARGVKSGYFATVEEHIINRLIKKGYVNLSSKAKDLRYDCGLITEKGYDYYCELRGLERKLRKSKWDLILKILTAANTAILIVIATKVLNWW